MKYNPKSKRTKNWQSNYSDTWHIIILSPIVNKYEFLYLLKTERFYTDFTKTEP